MHSFQLNPVYSSIPPIRSILSENQPFEIFPPMPIALESLNTFDRESFVVAVGDVFEHSPWIAEETWPRRPFRDVVHLHAELCATLRRASPERRLALIRAHPDLAGRVAPQRKLTAESTHEQATAGLDQLSDDETAEFQKLNDAYRARFDFPFVICARLNAKDAILAAMQTRILNSPAAEFATAIAEIEKIAHLRLRDTVHDG